MRRQPFLLTIPLLLLAIGYALADPVDVNPDGEASGDIAAVSGTGPASGGFVGVSGGGPAEGGVVALSAGGAAAVPSRDNCIHQPEIPVPLTPFTIGESYQCTSGGVEVSGGDGRIRLTSRTSCGGSPAPSCPYDATADGARIETQSVYIGLLYTSGRPAVAMGAEDADASVVAISSGGSASSGFVAMSTAGPAEGGLVAASGTGDATIPGQTNCLSHPSLPVLGQQHHCSSGGVEIDGGAASARFTNVRTCSQSTPPSCAHTSGADVLRVSGQGGSAGAFYRNGEAAAMAAASDDAKASSLAVSGAGDAEAGMVAASAFGEGRTPLDSQCLLLVGQYICQNGGLEVSGGEKVVNATHQRSCSGTGSEPSCPRPDRNGLSVGDDDNVEGDYAVSGSGNSSGWVAVSGTGSATGETAISGCTLLTALERPDLCT